MVVKTQRELLQSSGWNVLIILDACRSDYFCQFCPQAETVISMATQTPDWVAEFNALAPSNYVYFSATPVVLSSLPSEAVVEHIWKDKMRRYSPSGGATVHPRHVNRFTSNYLAQRGQPEHLIIHYGQPHTPYIGKVRVPYPLLLQRISGKWEFELSLTAAHAEGLVTEEQLRNAYESNLQLVLPFAQRLAKRLAGRVVMTADHGECLGEHQGLFGHGSLWEKMPEACFKQLLEVPWLELDNGPFDPAPVCRECFLPRGKHRLMPVLEALGYV